MGGTLKMGDGFLFAPQVIVMRRKQIIVHHNFISRAMTLLQRKGFPPSHGWKPGKEGDNFLAFLARTTTNNEVVLTEHAIFTTEVAITIFITINEMISVVNAFFQRRMQIFPYHDLSASP